jgi:syntaxin 18
MQQIELTNMMDAVQETERRMLEMSALNHLFSTHVLHQAQQIELLYLQASSLSLSLSLSPHDIRVMMLTLWL